MLKKEEQRLITSTKGPLSGSVSLQGLLPRNLGLIDRFRKLESYAVVYVYSGNGFYCDENGYEHDIAPGNLIILFPGLSHQYRPNAGTWGEIFFILDGPAIRSLEESGLIDRKNPVLKCIPVEYWKTRLSKALPQSTPINDAAVARNFFQVMQLLTEMIHESRATHQSPSDEEWLLRARRALEQSLGNDASLEAAARRVGTASVDTFRKRFSRLQGNSPGNYRFQFQIEKASHLLSTTGDSLAEIAEQLGFHDAFHFSKRFKVATGMSPSQFRERYRSE